MAWRGVARRDNRSTCGAESGETPQPLFVVVVVVAVVVVVVVVVVAVVVVISSFDYFFVFLLYSVLSIK